MRNLLCALLIPFMVLSSTGAWSQSKKDTLTVAEKHELAVAYRNSCFGKMQLVDSCSMAKDSIAAGNFLISVNPLYFYLRDQTPATIDT
ncbi:MAG: hypothetical protein EBR36_02470, partial [Methylophilaceae bacterium]|nr:hypothetical protein [Methylophilaceae bacterium]